MPEFSINFARSARKELEDLPGQTAERILNKVASLGKNPRPSGCIKLQGPGNAWRIRIGDYRVIYEIDDRRKLIDVSVIRHRKDVYR